MGLSQLYKVVNFTTFNFLGLGKMHFANTTAFVMYKCHEQTPSYILNY